MREIVNSDDHNLAIINFGVKLEKIKFFTNNSLQIFENSNSEN